MHADIDRKLFSEEKIVEGIDRVAKDVTAHYQDKPFTVISVLKGSCIFASDLIRRIPIPLELGFCAASSYGSGTESGKLKINFLPEENEVVGHNLLPRGRHPGYGQHHVRLEAGIPQARGRRGALLRLPGQALAADPGIWRRTSGVFEVEDLFVVGLRPGLCRPLSQSALRGVPQA